MSIPGHSPGASRLSADGTTPFDFASALGIGAATPANPVIYDITISMDNNATAIQRMSFALGTVESSAGDWDFGLQLYRAVAGETFYTVGKRIDVGSSGLGSDQNAAILTMAFGHSELRSQLCNSRDGRRSGKFHLQLAGSGLAGWRDVVVL